jgi:hypothetical protein
VAKSKHFKIIFKEEKNTFLEESTNEILLQGTRIVICRSITHLLRGFQFVFREKYRTEKTGPD